LLDDQGIEYRYREYTKESLSAAEIRQTLKKLGAQPHDLMRKNDKNYKALGIDASRDPEELIALMAEHPTMMQRPIGVLGRKAVVGRPPEKLLELL